jgi:hypothetical protein
VPLVSARVVLKNAVGLFGRLCSSAGFIRIKI